MGDALADAFRAELPCSKATATLLASLARERRGLLGGGSEDVDEDLIVRLRDPRAFGAFAEGVLQDRRADAVARQAVVEHTFDLLPLPRSEGEVFEVQARAPPHLLGLANYLASSEGLTLLHVMHLVYAVFLDRSLFMSAPRPTRARIFHAVLGQADASENLRAFYASLFLATVPETEAAAEFRRALRSRSCPRTLCVRLATMAIAGDGGRSDLVTAAQAEGLLPAEVQEPQSPEVLANIPRLPDRLAAAGRRYLERDRAR